ncbi:hypothetical protein GEV33_002311 [Tenebrio molitor]|uniref:Uncharacterized protein n=1 Tax=Tenebrio molitor TaxID=7067 RepID=A0A8J6HKN1_TENMO|nr:hypothetical protein GEV33_002311 [Tenebrio molitor]
MLCVKLTNSLVTSRKSAPAATCGELACTWYEEYVQFMSASSTIHTEKSGSVFRQRESDVMDRNSMRLGLRTTGQSVGLRLLRATKRPRGSNGAPIGALPDRTPRGTLRPPRRATRETLLCGRTRRTAENRYGRRDFPADRRSELSAGDKKRRRKKRFLYECAEETATRTTKGCLAAHILQSTTTKLDYKY